ncbi:MAG: hypothetical protein JW700_03765 [Candidatus Aenigmarchaeota archaeon]|nr:hypothetical protein [Candidatus Aenigmarchaeota archaeon]
MSNVSALRENIRKAILYVLKPQKNSRILIINRTSNKLSDIAFEVSRELGFDAKIFLLDKKEPYDHFPKSLLDEIKSKKYQRAIGFFSYPKGMGYERIETAARVEMINNTMVKTNIGYMHAPGIDMDMALNGPLNCDYKKMSENSKKLGNILENIKSMHVTSPSGTDVTIEIPKGLVFQTDCEIVPPGPYGDLGKVGNLPVGEWFIEKRHDVWSKTKKANVSYPIKLVANGTVVCDICAGGLLKLLDKEKPIVVSFENGVATDFYSKDKDFEPLKEEWLRNEKEYNLPTVLEEVGIGLNDKARRTPNLLEAEKILGTVHFAPANVRSHCDLLVDKPTMRIFYENGNERVLIEKGKLIL